MEGLWIDVDELINYTGNEKIKARESQKIEYDILMAQAYIKWYTKNNFSSFTEIPTDVKFATVRIAEYLAAKSINNIGREGYSNETFDDYSYTKSDNFKSEIEQLGIGFLLVPYINSSSETGNIVMRLRKL